MEITLSAAELFLLSWAIAASVFAVWLQFEVRKAVVMMVMTMGVLRDVADGKARVEMKDEQLIIERILPLRKNEG